MPCRAAIASMSLGRAWVHKLPAKLDAAAHHGFSGVEIFYEDLEYYSNEEFGGNSPSQLLSAAHAIRALCASRRLSIICLQPFWQYDGLLDRAEHARMMDKFALWLRLAKALDTQTIQIPSNFLPAAQLSSDFALLVSDLREAAELAAAAVPPIRIAYESLAWATHVDTWDLCWAVVAAVDLPNCGVCLDTFNIAGRVYADPARADGLTGPDAARELTESCRRLAATVDPSKIFFVQVVDAERLEKPLVEGHEYHVEGQPARMSWSRNCRLFYGEEDRGAYLPVKEVAKVFLEELGFEGWVSMELFSRTMNEAGEGVPWEHARRGAEAWRKLKEDVRFETVEREEEGAGHVLDVEAACRGLPAGKGGLDMGGMQAVSAQAVHAA